MHPMRGLLCRYFPSFYKTFPNHIPRSFPHPSSEHLRLTQIRDRETRKYLDLQKDQLQFQKAVVAAKIRLAVAIRDKVKAMRAVKPLKSGKNQSAKTVNEVVEPIER